MPNLGSSVLNIAILSRGPNLYSTSRLRQACEESGHKVRVIDHLRCFVDITSDNPSVHYLKEEFRAKDFDAVIPRIGASVTFYGCAMVRQFEMMGVHSLNESVAITRARDKLRSLQLLARKGVGIPVTSFAHTPDNVHGLIREVGGSPLVIKLLEGTQGKGVVLAETQKAAESVIQAFMETNTNILVQEYIREAGGSDIRCFVIGNKVVAAIRRQASEGEFRSNLHRGGSAHQVTLTSQERATAVNAARSLGLHVCGVAILSSDRGPLVTEVNAWPGLRGVEEVTQVDVATLIVQFIEKNSKPNRTKTKGKG